MKQRLPASFVDRQPAAGEAAPSKARRPPGEGARQRGVPRAGQRAQDVPAKRASPVDLGPLGEKIGYVLRRAQLAVFDEVIRSFAELDLRPGQYSVLAVVGHRPGLKQSAVAAALGIQRANFVALINTLERRGLARRSAVPNDRRSYALHLTAEGERVLARAEACVAAVEARYDAKLGPGGRARLLNLLRRLGSQG
jgi:DNA-binding MarR family transcriptional regulator